MKNKKIIIMKYESLDAQNRIVLYISIYLVIHLESCPSDSQDKIKIKFIIEICMCHFKSTVQFIRYTDSYKENCSILQECM